MIICPWCRFEVVKNSKKICNNCDKIFDDYIEIDETKKILLIGETFKIDKYCINCGESVENYTIFKSKKMKYEYSNKLLQLLFTIINVVLIFGKTASEYKNIIKVKVPLCDCCKSIIKPVYFHPFERIAYFIVNKNG